MQVKCVEWSILIVYSPLLIRKVKVKMQCLQRHSIVATSWRSRFARGGQEVIQKPKCIMEYYCHMGGVDLSDQMISYYSFHQTVKMVEMIFSI